MGEFKNRVAIIDGCRTPFLRSGTGYRHAMAWELGRHAVKGLISKAGIASRDVDHVIMGTVAADIATTNVAREIALGAGLAETVVAHTCTMACISANMAITNGANLISSGNADTVIAGGVDTFSDVDIRISKPYRQFILDLTLFKKPKSWSGRLALIKKMRVKDFFIPDPPAIAEYATGLTMGQNADRLSLRVGISRADQDRYAEMSHRRAIRAQTSGSLRDEIVPVVMPGEAIPIETDNGPRADATFEKLAKLKPAFDRQYGTVTAGNASFLTDGASAVLLMNVEKATALGLQPMGLIRSFAYTGQNLYEELLLGPAFAIPKALDRAGLALSDIGVLEIHEAFAAQMVANLRCLSSRSFAAESLGRSEKIGEVDLKRLNRHGGSLSLGHPFGATGGRLVATCCHRMKEENARYGLVAGCAAGGQGSAIVIEAA